MTATGRAGARLSTTGAPLAVLAAACIAAWWWPQVFVPLKPFIVPGLGVIMFGMGMTLRADDLAAVARRPRWLLLGVALQFLVMPAAAWLIATLLALPPLLALGLVLTGSCPGGTASNVMAYLARGNVALSVSMTTASTLLAPLATPWLTWWLVGERIDVPVWNMFVSILTIVILPVALGMTARWAMPALTRRIEPVFPWLSVAVIALLVAIIIALSRGRLADVGTAVVLAVVLHNAAGLSLGYVAAAWAGAPPRERRTIALEVGMQNSGLATALVIKLFAPLAALPSAVFSVWHNVSALILVSSWRREDQSCD